MYRLISRIIVKAEGFEKLTQINIQQKLKPFLEVCDISKVASPSSDAEKTSPLSPKRESPVVGEEYGKGKRLKVPSWKVRRNLDEEIENVQNVQNVQNIQNVQNVQDDNEVHPLLCSVVTGQALHLL